MGFFDRILARQDPPTPDVPASMSLPTPVEQAQAAEDLNVDTHVQGKPRGGSGRAHYRGFLQFEELNAELLGRNGLSVYDRMYRTDGDVRQVVNLAVNPIIGGTWGMQPYGGEDAKPEDREYARIIEWMLLESMTPNLIDHLAEILPLLVRSGFTPAEQIWHAIEFEGKKYLAPRTLPVRLPRSVWRWYQNDGGELTGIQQFLYGFVPSGAVTSGEPAPNTPPPPDGGGSTSGPGVGMVDLAITDLIYYRVGAEGDNWEGISMLRPAYKHWKMKDAIERIDAIAQEREAVGIPICYPPVGVTSDQLEAVETILGGMRTNEQGYIVAPGPYAGDTKDAAAGWRFDILSQHHSGRDPMPSMSYHTMKIAAAFISEFMQLGHGGGSGSRNTAQIQVNPFLAAVEALAGIVEGVLNDQLVAKIVALNFPDAKDRLPKLKMSIVDATSLAQLADFVNKLVMVGVMIPDNELEDWLRDRADLPPAEESFRKEITVDDRLEILKGQMSGESGMGDGKAPSDNKSAANDQRSAQNRASGSKSETQSHDAEFITRLLGRAEPPGPWGYEHHLDPGMGEYMDGLRDNLAGRMRTHVHAMAVEAQGGAKPKVPKVMLDDMGYCLDNAHTYGRMTARGEIQKMRFVIPPRNTELAKAASPTAAKRARALAEQIRDTVHHSAQHSRITGDHGMLNHAQKAGNVIARTQGANHLHGTFHEGRMLESSEQGVDKFYYHARIDKNSCGVCRNYDDGVARTPQEWLDMTAFPPNPHCESTASGENRCRCFLVPATGDSERVMDAALVPNDPNKTNWVEKRGGLPKYIADRAGDLISERGKTTQEAIEIAVGRTRDEADGTVHATPETRAKAEKAIAQWERMKSSG